jgi:peptide/nickel transport system ATP-binding protein
MSEPDAPADGPLLRIEALGVLVGPPERRIMAVRDITLAVEPGMRLGIVGESGSGKSTTALAVMGLLPKGATITSGSIVYRGEELIGASDARYRALRGSELAIVFQNAGASLNPLIRVGDQIADIVREHTGASKAEAQARAVEMLGAMGIGDPERRARGYPHQYSGGMAQRALLGMALACRPRLLIADEPTTGLDPVVQVHVIDRIVEQVRQQGSSLMIISHDLAVISRAATHVVVMYAGGVVEHGPRDVVLGEPAHPYTRALLAAVGVGADGRFSFIPGRVPVLGPDSVGCDFRDRCPLRAALGDPAICAAERPALRAAGPDHAAACHFVGAAAA